MDVLCISRLRKKVDLCQRQREPLSLESERENGSDVKFFSLIVRKGRLKKDQTIEGSGRTGYGNSHEINDNIETIAARP